MENLVNTLFYPTKYIKKGGWDRCLTDYAGKHYLEKFSNEYVSCHQFQILMEQMGHKPRQKDGRYYLRPRKEYVFKYS